MEIKIFNTLTKEKEDFKPLNESEVKIYSCGPTVYDRQHIGNLRSAVIWDLLSRTFKFLGFNVEQVINITDFGHLSSDADEGEDKMVKGLRREGLSLNLESMKKMAEKYAELYFEDRKKLNILEVSHFPFASDYIKEDIDFISQLQEKGFVYQISDGLYFDTSKLEDYGKLPGITENTQSRTGENSLKKNLKDFVLWKFNKDIGWNSPWGKGFPGWHIECSVMSLKFLGETFDIHTGGIEHIPIHHNNEIAQSESLTGKQMANYFMHNEHLILPGGKMAKSAGNSITLKEVENKGFNPLALRLLFLQSHYRSQITFSWEALESSSNALDNIKQILIDNKTENEGSVSEDYLEKFKIFISDDLDIPKALALFWDLLKDKEIEHSSKIKTALEFDKVFGLELAESLNENKKEIPQSILDIAEQREEARKNKDWNEADRLREKIEEQGYKIKDGSDGPIVS